MEEDPRISEARRLLFEVERDLQEKKKLEYAQDKCQCGHARVFHGVSWSINYTEGMCHKCKCKYFSTPCGMSCCNH